MIRKRGATTHICLMHILMDYSYNCGIMTQDHDPCPHHTEIDEKGMLLRSQKHVPSQVPVYQLYPEYDVYGYRSSDNVQRQGS